MGFLYEELETARKYNPAAFAMPKEIVPNLNPAFEVRPYQRLAFENFAFHLAGPTPGKKPMQVLFHMATGSGKTLMMAGLIIYLYKKGYRDFLFFVNLSNIVQKTKENFLNSRSSKFLFAPEIGIDGDRVPVKEVDNFQDSDPKAINICFTTTQGLHSDIWNAKENSITLNDFDGRKIVLISDEAHHLNADTKKMNETESASYHSWEETVKKIFMRNAENILLEFTATCDLKNPQINAEYRDKIIFNYPLSEFRKDGYSKEIMTLRTDVKMMDRALMAVVLSQYRLKVFQSAGLLVKPVVLFKARTVKESEAFMDAFIATVAKLKAKDIARLAGLTDNGTMKRAFAYFQVKKITDEQLAQELRLDFSKEHCISANDEKEAGERQLALNSLEEVSNPYRAVFEVKKLDEGWDVLNLFDIVRLYETRQSGGKAISSTTIAEAQLIGRGSRYYPFILAPGQEKFRRKYDNDAANQLRICEELYYHCQIDPRYIAELKNALKNIGADIDKSKTCEYKLKELFRRDGLYRCGYVFVNEQVEKSRKEVFGIPEKLRAGIVDYKEATGNSREGVAMEDVASTETFRKTESKVFKIAELAAENYAYVWSALCKFPALRFDNLKRYFPNLESSREFITDGHYLGEMQLSITAVAITPDVKCNAVEKALAQVAASVESIETEYYGTKEFRGKRVKELITDKTCVYTDPEIATGGRGVSQREGTFAWQLDLSKEDWYAQEDNYGTTEEKAFVAHFRSLVSDLQKSYAKIWLVRNEGQVAIYSFDGGRRFEPDFIVFLRKRKNSKKTEHIQIFVEPKGSHLIETDKWKEDFLLDLKNRGVKVIDINDDADYKIRGCHFYNDSDAMRKVAVTKELREFCDKVGPQVQSSVPVAKQFVEYLPLYSIKAACHHFEEAKENEVEGWVRVSGIAKKNPNLYIVRAEGDSMEPMIKDGEYCVFEYRNGTCDNNDVVLVAHAKDPGDDLLAAFVIKKFVGVRSGNKYASVRLVPVNDDFDEIKLTNKGKDVRKYKVVGVRRSKVKVVS